MSQLLVKFYQPIRLSTIFYSDLNTALFRSIYNVSLSGKQYYYFYFRFHLNSFKIVNIMNACCLFFGIFQHVKAALIKQLN